MSTTAPTLTSALSTVAPDELLPLSQAQLGIWLGHQRAADPSVYNAGECLRLDGPLDRDRFEQALDETQREARALQLAFVERQGQPRLHPTPYRGAILTHLDLRAHPDPEAALGVEARRALDRPLTIAEGELQRHQLVRLSDQRHAWVHVAHHIALDGYGFALFARRLAARYTALDRGCPAGGPEAVGREGFAELEPVLAEDAAYQSSSTRELDRRFWRAEVAGAPGLTLGSGRPRGVGRGRRRRLALPPGLSGRLRATATERGLAWPELSLALVAALVHTETGARAFSLGVPVMLRLGSKSGRVPCMAMNIAPLPLHLEPGAGLLDLARQLRASLVRQRPHHRYRYEHLALDLGPGVRPFGPVVNITPFEAPLRFGACPAALEIVSPGPAEDVAFGIAPRGDELELTLEVHPSALDERSQEQLAARFVACLERHLADPTGPLLPARGRSAGPTSGALAEPVWLPAALARHARERPAATALVAGDRIWSYRELDQAVRGGARALSALGVGPGALVAFELPRDPRAVILVLAIQHTGAGYLAIDPTLPLSRRQLLLDEAAPQLLVTGPSDLRPPAGTAALAADDQLLVRWSRAGAGEAGPPPTRPAPGDVAYLVYTSGSTGAPKAVAVPASALAHFLAAAQTVYRIEANDRVLQFAPLSFDASVEELGLTFAAGATLVLRRDEMMESLPAFLAGCARAGITVLDLPTAFWHELALALADEDGLALRLPASVRLTIIGGEAALPGPLRRWRRQARHCRLLNTYGPSEATVVATAADLGDHPAIGGGDNADEAVPIGRPLPGVQALLVDEDGQIIDGEGGGELLLAGATLASGYWRREDLTRARFVSLPGVGRAYRTGDRVRRDANGQLVFLGRLDDEIKISGYRIAPAEVEAALTRHPGVRAAVVQGRPGPDGIKHLVAHLEGDPTTLDGPQLRQFLSGLLPAAMIPTAFIIVAALPRTRQGKLDRAALAVAAPTTTADNPAPVETDQEVDGRILGAWRQVLGLAQIGPDDDFFALGGNSLQVLQLTSRLARLGPQVTVAAIFRHPTPRRQAELLAGGPEVPAAPFVPAAVDLPEAFFPLRPLPARPAGPRRVLLTGATGYLGLHLLGRLLGDRDGQVVATVRAGSGREGRRRLEEAARCAEVDLTGAETRLEVLPMDLADPALDVERLAHTVERCDAIFHAAAQVSVARDYASLLRANVLVTRDLLTLAAAWGASFHHVSSISTLPAPPGDRPIPEAFFPIHPALRDGYQRSKWHSEVLCERAGQRGLSVAVYRLGRLTGARTRPRVNPADLVWRIAGAASRLGAWPDLPFAESWTPVDAAADALVHLAARQSAVAPARAYHLVHGGLVQLDRVRQALANLGLHLAVVPLPAFVERLRTATSDADRATLTFFEGQERHPAATHAAAAGDTLPLPTTGLIAWDQVRTLAPDLDPASAAVDDRLLAAYCRSAVADGLIALT